MVVMVTRKDIDAGEQCSQDGCPLALAMTRACGREVAVRLTDYFFKQSDSLDCKPLPATAVSFRRLFDNERCDRSQLEPFSFTIGD